MPAPTAPGPITLDLALRPRELVAAWRSATRRLLLPVAAPAARNQRVQAWITVVGMGVGATVTGRVVSTLREQGRSLVEVAPDDTRLQAVERLVAIAAGTPVAYAPRAPRLLAALPAVVSGLHGPTYMTTFAVSANGCGLSWSGPVPDVGTPMEIRLGAGREAASFCAEVRWTSRGRAPTVGVCFAAGERDAWTRMLSTLKRSGAPPA